MKINSNNETDNECRVYASSAVVRMYGPASNNIIIIRAKRLCGEWTNHPIA